MIHVQEDRLQHCLHRLSSLLGSRQVLLGAGHVESYCADRLDQLAGYICVDEIFTFFCFTLGTLPYVGWMAA